MPPTFVLFMCWAAYFAAAGIGLAVRLVLAFASPTRRTARRAAGGIVGSLLGTALLQVAVLPVSAVLWVVLSVVGKRMSEPHGLALAMWIVLVAAATFGVFGFTSLFGLINGWGIGSRICDGWTVGAAVRASVAYRLAFKLLPRRDSYRRSNQRLELP
jgi:hypothetical protein